MHPLDNLRTPKLYHSIVENLTNTPALYHISHTINMTYPDLADVRVARSFNPFNDLYDIKKRNETQRVVPKRDPLKEYREAVLMWQELYPREMPPNNFTMGEFEDMFSGVCWRSLVSFVYVCGRAWRKGKGGR